MITYSITVKVVFIYMYFNISRENRLKYYFALTHKTNFKLYLLSFYFFKYLFQVVVILVEEG